MTWRYQPVWINFSDEAVYSLAQVDVDAAGRLENWTQTERTAPAGEAASDLRERIAHMLMDANLYKPVAFSSLKIGMLFERVGE
jgi:hypothetical protein